jgi:hypothetical protein
MRTIVLATVATAVIGVSGVTTASAAPANGLAIGSAVQQTGTLTQDVQWRRDRRWRRGWHRHRVCNRWGRCWWR